MELNIIYSENAIRDLKEIYDYIRKDSFHYAKKEIKEIRHSIKKLRLNRFQFKRFEKAEDDLTREMIFKNYRIIFDIIPNKQVIILTIHHHSRLVNNNPALKSD